MSSRHSGRQLINQFWRQISEIGHILCMELTAPQWELRALKCLALDRCKGYEARVEYSLLLSRLDWTIRYKVLMSRHYQSRIKLQTETLCNERRERERERKRIEPARYSARSGFSSVHSKLLSISFYQFLSGLFHLIKFYLFKKDSLV